MAAQNSVGVNTSTVPSVPTIPPPQQPEIPPIQQDQQQIQTELTSTTEENITPLVTGSAVSIIEEEQGDFTFGEDEESFEEPFTDDVIDLPDPDPNVVEIEDLQDKTEGVESFDIDVIATPDKVKAIKQATAATWGNSINNTISVKNNIIASEGDLKTLQSNPSKTGIKKFGLCALYTYNHAYNYTRIILNKTLKTDKKTEAIIPTDITKDGKFYEFKSRGPHYYNKSPISFTSRTCKWNAGGNANEPGYWNKLVTECKYTQQKPQEKTFANLLIYLTDKENNNFQIGDVVTYWNAPSDSNFKANHFHTQIYVGGYQDTSKLGGGFRGKTSKWATDHPTNYSSFIPYGADKNTWTIIVFRAPSPTKNTT